MNVSTCIQLVKSCGNARNPVLAKQIHDQIRGTHHENDRLVANLLVEMYGKCGQMREAKEAFDSIKEPNVFSSTIFLTAYAQNGHIVAAKSFFDQMSERNIYSWTTLITSFASYKDLESALDTFTRMPAWNNATWNSIVSAYTQAGHILDFMDFEKFNTEMTCNALIWVFLQNGDLDKARDLFESASHRDIVSWNTLLQGYVDWELIEEAANLFERMPAHNAVSCTSVISGFSLVGDFDRGQSVISSILQWDVVAVNAMLQFLAEFGLIQEAFGRRFLGIFPSTAPWPGTPCSKLTEMR
ncbi:pentatricopeptide repeat-containing protein At2g35030, mitochondrial-like [Selaginella moellendorffii]|uniref:pentatricopeptide repeat-containing protein At2g35030, mitochondrial-like n=1 Tax=Selaginella moellendorffii TaxID=88036 RepID=UPI000D1CA724|nr:pentatricopeptide repeat-containing protein At2g35030, mitochondrial-like [Selaginella moellendorffii]|eukprot:XP_024540693.1 pentatricopeptide repeat-containing protein At2g35030, mitochondrial-like [Selaginella moellendorffii]